MKQFVLRCENAVKACDKIDPQIEEGKWHEIKKTPTKPSSQVPYLPISGWHPFPSNALPNILIMVTYTITLWRV